jgi:hypothetical protein
MVEFTYLFKLSLEFTVKTSALITLMVLNEVAKFNGSKVPSD